MILPVVSIKYIENNLPERERIATQIFISLSNSASHQFISGHFNYSPDAPYIFQLYEKVQGFSCFRAGTYTDINTLHRGCEDRRI